MDKLNNTYKNKYIIGITGEIGCGKSYVSDALFKIATDQNLECHNIEFDNLGHEILETLTAPYYNDIRKLLIKTFGENIKNKDNNFINRNELRKIVFNDNSLLKKLNNIMHAPLIKRVNEIIDSLNGIILINGALIIDFNMTKICNNNIVLIDTNKELQYKRLQARNLTKNDIEKRIKAQLSYKEKYDKLSDIIENDALGNIILFQNNDATKQDIEKLLNKIMDNFKI